MADRSANHLKPTSMRIARRTRGRLDAWLTCSAVADAGLRPLSAIDHLGLKVHQVYSTDTDASSYLIHVPHAVHMVQTLTAAPATSQLPRSPAGRAGELEGHAATRRGRNRLTSPSSCCLFELKRR